MAKWGFGLKEILKEKEKRQEAPTYAESYAAQRHYGVLNKKEGEQLVALMKRAGFKVSETEGRECTIVRVDKCRGFVIDKGK